MTTLAEQRIATINEKHEKALADAEREIAVLKRLPSNVPEPRFLHVHSLYGADLSLEYGDTGRFSYREESNPNKRPYTLFDAVTFLQSFDQPDGLFAIVPFFAVKDSCLSLKPGDAITEKEHERADITGPYDCKIVLDGWHRKLCAFVQMGDVLTRVSIELDNRAQLGYWSREPGIGNERYPESLKWNNVFANIGQARSIAYSGGSCTGDGSKGQMVYCFHSPYDIDLTADPEYIEPSQDTAQ